MRPLVALLLACVLAARADAASVCQKGNKVKLRPGACKGKETAVIDLGVDLSGTWKRRDGTAFTSGSLVATFLELKPDGTGNLNRRDDATNLLDCRALRYSRGSGTPTAIVDLQGAASEVVQASRAGDALTIVNDAGTSTFDRAPSVDAGAACGTLVETSRLRNLPAPGRTGLATDGATFVYLASSDAAAVRVDATTGALGTAPLLDSFGRVPAAFEGPDVWGTCACGSDSDAARSAIATGTQVDRVNTGDLLGTPAPILALAVPEPGRLLLLARTFASGSVFSAKLLLVDTAAEPDTLVSSVDMNVNLQSMTMEGPRLWGLTSSVSPAVVRLDPTTGSVTGTFIVPDTTIQWRGIAAVPGTLFLRGTAADNTGVIAAFAAPAP